MDSGRPFTDMIIEGLPPAAVSDNIPPRSEIQARDEVPAAKRNQGRTKNFTVDEDKMLVSAWLNVSLDPVRGVDQSKSTYWKRIHDYFHTHKQFDSNGSQSSLMSRWSGIQHDCNIFASCVSRAEARNQSGASMDDKQPNAFTMFKNEDPQHKTFLYIHCWKILKDQPKWKERLQHIGPQKPVRKKQRTTDSSTPATDAPASDVDEAQATMTEVDRPTGAKKEKRKKRSAFEALDYLLAKKKEADAAKELKKKRMCQKALAIQEEQIKLEKDKFDFEGDLQEERIMNVDTSTMSSKQQFYAWLHDKILARQLRNY